MSDADELERITESLARTVVRVRASLVSDKREVVLDAFWGLQDLLHQLRGYMSDHPLEISVLTRVQPSLIRDVVDLLMRANRSSTSSIFAVQKSCSAINESLAELQRMKDKKLHHSASNRN